MNGGDCRRRHRRRTDHGCDCPEHRPVPDFEFFKGVAIACAFTAVVLTILWSLGVFG